MEQDARNIHQHSCAQSRRGRGRGGTGRMEHSGWVVLNELPGQRPSCPGLVDDDIQAVHGGAPAASPHPPYPSHSHHSLPCHFVPIPLFHGATTASHHPQYPSHSAMEPPQPPLPPRTHGGSDSTSVSASVFIMCRCGSVYPSRSEALLPSRPLRVVVQARPFSTLQR